MAVEEIHLPPKTSSIDPKVAPRTPSYWENEAKEARARREYLQEQKIAEEITNPPPMDAPFKVQGGINLGTIDIQENMRRAEDKADLDRKEAQRQVIEERTRREAAEERARNYEIAVLKEQVTAGMNNLEKMIASSRSTPSKSFTEQLDEVTALANKLGLAERNNSDDPKMKLEMFRLQADMAAAERDYKRELRNDDKRWQIELAKLDIQKKADSDKLQHEKDRNELFSNAFKNVGAAIAQGLLANAESSIPAAAAGPVARQAQEPKFKVQVPRGRAGEVACPQCGEPIGVGPSTTRAVCANCGLSGIIERINEEPVAPPPTAPVPETEDLESEKIDAN